MGGNLVRLGARLRQALGVPARAHVAAARRYRLEPFGGIVQTLWPRALVFGDREYMRAYLRGAVPETELAAQWQGRAEAPPAGRLSAPLEAHLQLTNHCEVGCQGCYTGANPQAGGAREWGLGEWQAAIDELAAAGVFHVALGGGESATLPWLGALAAHCWARGVVPNLTTSGLAGLAELLPICDRFAQINVSLDGLAAGYQRVRGVDGFARAVAAARALRARKREVGINIVVTRHNFHELPAVVALAAELGLNEVEFLRYKPSGRAAKGYADMRCTDAQHWLLYPTLMAAARRYRMRVKVDCSFVPMLACHQPAPEMLAQLMVYGCTAGDFLVAAKAGGQLAACSFAPAEPAATGQASSVNALRQVWADADRFAAYRNWASLPAPCADCDYREYCRGGCRVVARHAGVTGGDPECPRVLAHGQHATIPRRGRLPVVAS